MGVVVAVAIQVGKYGATLFASRFLATNARMVVAVAIQVGKYGATVFASRFLATNACGYVCRPKNIPFVNSWLSSPRLKVPCSNLASKTNHSCIRG